MSGDVRVTGFITIDPPLTWARARDSLWLTTKDDDDRNWSGPGNYREVLLRVMDSARDTDTGIVIDRLVDQIVPAPGETNGYYLTEQIQAIVDEIGPGHTFAGHLECTWRGAPMEVRRIAVRDGRVVELRPKVTWPDDAPQFEPATDQHHDAVWLNHDGYVDWLPEGDSAPEGWRRLYVETVAGGAA